MSGIAIFDFDDTLVKGDSLLPFLVETVGRGRAWSALAQAAVDQAIGRAGADSDRRSRFKERLIARCLAGVPVTVAVTAAERLVSWTQWRPDLVAALNAHHAAGRKIVVASGALDLYLPVLLRGLPVDAVLATPTDRRDGVLTGRLGGANCVRGHKAARVADYLDRHGPFAESWGYGNRPSDLPMLALVDHPTVV